MNPMRPLVSSLLLALVSACQPQTGSTPPSVDGFTGGDIAGEVRADRVSAKTLSSENAQLADVTAKSVSTQTLAVSGDARVAGALDVETLSGRAISTAALSVGGTNLKFPIIRGRARRDDEVIDLANRSSGYDASDEACVASYGADAHACGAQEALLAWYLTPNPEMLNLEGSAVNVFQPYMAGLLKDLTGSPTYPLIIDDCQGWQDVAREDGLTFGGDELGPPGDIAPERGSMVEFVHGYLAIHPAGGRPLMRVHNTCLKAFDVACCGAL